MPAVSECIRLSKKMDNKRITAKKAAVSILAALILIVLYVIIFSFSGQDSEESGKVSSYVSIKCVEILNVWTGRQWTGGFLTEAADFFENPIRKTAHFAEYACMGVLVYSIWRQWLERGGRLYFITMLWTIVSAAADEIHQLFIPGRCGCFTDVCLDTVGAVSGMLFCILLEKAMGKALDGRHVKCVRK